MQRLSLAQGEFGVNTVTSQGDVSLDAEPGELDSFHRFHKLPAIYP